MGDPVAPVRWFSARAVFLHVSLVVAVPLCAVAGWWQVDRALSGNTLSWIYVFEWPAFAMLSAWCWWVLLHVPAVSGSRTTAGNGTQGPQGELLARRRAAPTWDRYGESNRLRAYNDYLAALNAGSAGPRPFPRKRSARAQ